MANVYVDSNAAGAGTGADWTNAYTTLIAAMAAKVAGDDFWVAHNHAETTAVVPAAFTCPGTLATPCRIICVNSAGTVPPVSADLRTTATIAYTGASSQATIQGCAYMYGITLNVATSGSGGISVNGTVQSDWYFKSCNLNALGTSAPTILIGSASNSIGARAIFDNTTVRFGAVGGNITVFEGGDFLWKNTVAAINVSGSAPTILFVGAAQGSGRTVCDGVDLIYMSTKTLVGAHTKGGQYYFKDCKLAASQAICTAPTGAAPEVYVTRSASGATAYTMEKYDYRGTETTEIIIVRTGGAAINGTSVAKKLVSSANSEIIAPFEATPMVINNTSTSSVTLTVYGIWGGGAVPTNADIWMEVGYLGSALTPILSFSSTGKADVLAAASNTTADDSTWGGSTTKFKMAATFTPAMAGHIFVTVKLGTASQTLYIDPLPVLT